MLPDAQRLATASPGLYSVHSTLPIYNADPASFSQQQAYQPNSAAAVNCTVDLANQIMDGSIARPYGAVASQRLPYDPNYDPTSAIVAATATGLTSGLPAHHPSAADPKRMVDPAFLAFLRSEARVRFFGDARDDGRSRYPIRGSNLAQARVLSRIVLSCKTGGVASGLRGRSNSFSHANYMQPQGLSMDPGLMQQPPQPPPAIQASVSPRMGEFLGRRPSSAPSQHLLETTYPGARPLAAGAYPVSPDYNQARSFSMYNAHTGLAMSALGAQANQVAPVTPGTAPKTFSGSYSPMELMKRPTNLPPASPILAASPMHSPQLLRKGINPVQDGTLVPAASANALQMQNLNNPRMVGRRTGPPVIVSTMATTPDTKDSWFEKFRTIDLDCCIIFTPVPSLSCHSDPVLSWSCTCHFPRSLSDQD
ncbi:hypothetical protein WMY93_010083 [Mugilogobius chulae]|uniref:Uncharacterized protein n=1 Tax=Mugilogobius chulae TaxID=88201 RepID=A0AAW0PFE3_9GOBI